MLPVTEEGRGALRVNIARELPRVREEVRAETADPRTVTAVLEWGARGANASAKARGEAPAGIADPRVQTEEAVSKGRTVKNGLSRGIVGTEEEAAREAVLLFLRHLSRANLLPRSQEPAQTGMTRTERTAVRINLIVWRKRVYPEQPQPAKIRRTPSSR